MSIFKDCDIRGLYPNELNEIDAYNIGRAVATKARGGLVAVSGDIRLSTHALKNALIRGLVNSGSVAMDIGLNPTPVFYFAKRIINAYAGVQVTASHNPADYNGMKLAFGNGPVTPEDIAEIERIIKEGSFRGGKGALKRYDGIQFDYFSYIMKKIRSINLKVVVDAGNGCAGKLAARMFRKAGAEAFPLFCDYDGEFPNRQPNPAVYENLKAACAEVVRVNADLGCAFDGDGDRVVFIDEKGAVIPSEKSFALFIRHYLKNDPAVVVYDQKSSSVVKNMIVKCGGEPVMERSGHAFIKRTFLEREAALAGEISGHFFFRELGGDDGMYAALKFAEILKGSGKKLSELVAEMGDSVITPDMRIFVPYNEQDSVVDRVFEYAKKYGYGVTSLDGVRVDFGDGWLLCRKSVTEEGVTVRAEAQTRDRLKEIVKEFSDNVPLYLHLDM